MTLAHKLLHFGAWATIVAALCSILTLTYWSVRPYRGLYNVPQPFIVATSPVEVGSLVTYTVSYCVDEKLPLPISVQREMEMQGPNNLLFPLAPPIGYLITQRCETRTLAFGVASYIPPGTYHIHYTTSLQVNPVRVIREQFISANFQVIPSAAVGKAADLVKEIARETAVELKAKK